MVYCGELSDPGPSQVTLTKYKPVNFQTRYVLFSVQFSARSYV